MSKHTPGPWRTSGADYRRIITDHGSAIVARVIDGEHGRIINERAMADASLIAAAPELLEALDRAHLQIIELLNEGDFKRKVVLDLSYIVDAIAKAEGR